MQKPVLVESPVFPGLRFPYTKKLFIFVVSSVTLWGE